MTRKPIGKQLCVSMSDSMLAEIKAFEELYDLHTMAAAVRVLLRTSLSEWQREVDGTGEITLSGKIVLAMIAELKR